jgi:heme exporter protein C
MWKFLYQLASPKSFFQITQTYLGYFGYLAAFCLVIGIFWGLFFTPADYQQGDAFRIIYVHVPAAFLSMGLFAAMAFWALLLLVWRIKLAGILIAASAQVGASMSLIALITGSIWGKPMWGTWWIWDARLTSELILLLLYLAILALSYAFKHHEQSDKLAAVLTLVGVIDLPVIHYSVYWWQTLHQGATLTLFAKPKIATTMLYPLIITLLGFAFFCGWLILHKACNALLLRERRQVWVNDLITNGNR